MAGNQNSCEDAPPQKKVKTDNVGHKEDIRSNFMDGQRGVGVDCQPLESFTASAGFTSQHETLIRYKLQTSINERYNRTACISLALDGYYYSDQGSISGKKASDSGQQEEDYFPIVKYELSEIESILPCQGLKIAQTASNWKSLSNKGKAALYHLLQFPRSLYLELSYIEAGKDSFWERRKRLAGDSKCTALKFYYPEDKERQKFGQFTDCLIDELTQAEIEPVDCLLADAWAMALLDGLNNGDGRTAVYMLFDRIVDLLPDMNIKTPVRVFHKTSTSKKDSFLVTDTSSASSESRGSSSSKHKGEALWIRQQLVDVVVVTQDDVSGFAKYICLIEVHSRGEDEDEADRQFKKEIVWALQAQNTVFGFLFYTKKVKFYSAERMNSGKIKIVHHSYMMTYSSDPTVLNVGNFQMLIMDILACLVFGIKHIAI